MHGINNCKTTSINHKRASNTPQKQQIILILVDEHCISVQSLSHV